MNVLPPAGASFKRKASIPISFQLADANGLLSDQAAASVRPSIEVWFEGQPAVGVSYNKKADKFSVSLKTGAPPAGSYNVFISITIGGIEVTSLTIPIELV